MNLTPKMQVAKELLGKALETYFDGAYFAAIHLAGGAEEILGTYVSRVTGTDNAFKSMLNAAVDFSYPPDKNGEASAQKSVRELMTYARNRTKHINPVGDDEIAFDPALEAKILLDRAVTDYHHLMNYMPLEDSALLRQYSDLRRVKS